MGNRLSSEHVVALWICVKHPFILLSIVTKTHANPFTLLFVGI
jgi:hypothetical protein